MTLDEVTRFTRRKTGRMDRLRMRYRRQGRRYSRLYVFALVIWREKRHELLAKIARQRLTIVDWMRIVAERDEEIQALKAQLDSFTRAN